MPMYINQASKTVIMAGAGSPHPGLEKQLNELGITVHWAQTIDAASALVNSAPDRTVVITELALKDGNWRDLVERVKIIDASIPILLLTGASTAELWWDALECGIEDIVPNPLSGSRLCEYLGRHLHDAR